MNLEVAPLRLKRLPSFSSPRKKKKSTRKGCVKKNEHNIVKQNQRLRKSRKVSQAILPSLDKERLIAPRHLVRTHSVFYSEDSITAFCLFEDRALVAHTLYPRGFQVLEWISLQNRRSPTSNMQLLVAYSWFISLRLCFSRKRDTINCIEYKPFSRGILVFNRKP